jgi:PAS domain S-box-containing protein
LVALLVAGGLLAPLLTGLAAASAPPIPKRPEVLVLHSYSPDFVWTRLQQDGIDAVFGPLAAAYDARVEYLDAVHHPELLRGPLVLDLLRAKLADQRFQVVLTSDNAAFEFARAHRVELFPGVPIVFTGVNGYEDSMLRGERGITGVAEDGDLSGTLQVLMQLMPQTKRIVFPGMADDLTYRAIRATVTKDLSALPPQVATEFSEYPDVDAALEALRALPSDSAIVVMANMRTRDGEGISSQRVVELVSAAAPVPVFTNWDFVVGHGAVGGSVISGVEQGRLAAEIAVRVLRGERPESIPVHRRAGKTFLFDQRQLARFQIPASRLPPGAVVLFSPERTYRIPREVAWTATFSLAALLLVVTTLVLAVQRRKRVEEELRDANERFRAILSAATDYSVIGTDLEGRVVIFSEGSQLMLGYRGDEVMGKGVAALLHDPVEVAARAAEMGIAPGFEVFAGAARRGGTETREWTYLRKDGQRLTVALTVAGMRGTGGSLIGFIGIARDVTERKLVEEAMRESEERYRQFFESSPISLWEESFTLGAEYFARLRAAGISDFRSYFESHPEAVEECIRMVKIVDVNKATLDLIGAKSKDELVAGLPRIFTKETFPLFREEIITLAEGGLHFETETAHKTLSGKEISVIVRMSVVAGHEETLERVLVSIVDITERKRSEESLALLNFALNNIRDEAYLITEQARFDYVNDHSCRALGYTREELLGSTGVAEVDPDFPAERWSEHWREIRERGSVTFEGRHRAKDGRIYPVEISANYFEYGGRGYNLALVRDITERKRIESALRASEQNLALHVNQTPLGVIEWDLDFRVTKWNPAAERIFGYSKKEALGCHASLIVPPGAKEQVDQVWSALVSRKGGLRSTNENTTKDGRTIHCEWYNTPLVEDSGEVIAVASLVEDVTERKAAENELLKLSSAIEQSPVSVVITDANGKIEYVNPKFTQVTGYGLEEVRGRNPRLLKSGSTPAEEYERLWAAITTGNVWNGTFCNRKKNGEPFWERETIAPVKNKAGDITHYIAIKEDITEMRRLEEQLRQAQKMEAIGTLAGGVAHDFNNILTAIIGYGSMVKMKLKSEDPLRESVDQILAASDRAAHLTHGLLAFSRKQLLNPRPVDVNDIVRNVEKLLRRIIGEDITLSTQLTEKSLVAMADSVQIEQVLMNFATNARDAMPQGGSLRISTQEIDLGEDFVAMHGVGKPGRHALMAVSDTGQGMDERTREKIFDPFFTTKEPGKGTGLGLAIVYGIIKQHNGTINVYSEPGKGSTFKIYLPLIVTETERAAEKEMTPPRGGTETILLAEDDRVVRDLTANILRGYGYRVIEAVDGVDALDKFAGRAKEIDLLILDVIMPRKSGKEAYDAIKALRSDVAALFISGYTADILQNRGIFEAGVDFISKPVSPFELLRKIREILDGRQQAG